MDFSKIQKESMDKINSVDNLDQLEKLRLFYLGKKGIISQEMKTLGSLSIQERKEVGKNLNNLKELIQQEIQKQKISINSKALNKKIKEEKFDLSLPPRNFYNGKIHPISQTIEEVINIFSSMGFALEEGPDIESDFHNFTALNIPPDHPAREMQDTFYLSDSEKNEKLVLRTHTSPVQIRTMIQQKPPLKIIVPGRTYRCDSDSTHAPMFHQVEGLLVDKNSTMANLKGCLVDFLKIFFEVDKLEYRFRPSYFPFTEPSAEMDIAYSKIDGVLKIGEGNEWLEILGCGMVNPRVLNNCGINSKIFQGFAFGMGIERISMLKYGISDLRSFFETDLRWLKHYGFDPLHSSSKTGL
ncbi:MAG: Phenylalanine--tRNA ligase alpha subunit [Alphaproteobacteria bacterium MarineAlpha5_Bin11]|nr:phenylalanine--tRNA ligase subunit alpha [Pelagibacteraceae bacterium]PPR44743.1 MAG: Phenylalanine--tRNA ligase alpha subunit [Alphaproteobacteria bacterium MarineAlpha5_Bin11]PPR52181.1 MAG: Phenylalanine--tRNA ligase alpha subunit [Alphaproteobacteria bacterium MarineAlpha5_Bin10]|tara:strand:+ start:279 stop:1343 length:1065 start_codon:yes stop_codon:yes gene_type:complete